MEPTLHCATPEPGCQAGTSDRVLANRFIYRFTDPDRGDIVVFETPPEASEICPGPGGVFVKRLVGLPGDQIEIRGVLHREAAARGEGSPARGTPMQLAMRGTAESPLLIRLLPTPD